jgi:hypothetical protein
LAPVVIARLSNPTPGCDMAQPIAAAYQPPLRSSPRGSVGPVKTS